MDFANYKLGYLLEKEDHASLAASAQNPEQYCFGDIDPKNLGVPIGAIDVLNVEDQQQLSSCAGNSFTTILEWCLYLQGNVSVALSRMYAYTQGQRYCNIHGDSGATLEGVIKAGTLGIPREEFMPYTGQYYTDVPEGAEDDAKNYKLESYSAIDIANPERGLLQIYEGLARRVGGCFIGIGCTQEIFNSQPDGLLNVYTPQRCGGHAMAFVDWCTERDERGWPYLLLANSWSRKYGYRGYRKVKPSAVMSMMRGQYASFYFLSDMKFMKPRYEWKSQAWLG